MIDQFLMCLSGFDSLNQWCCQNLTAIALLVESQPAKRPFIFYIGCPKSNTHIEYFDWSFVLWRSPEETNPWVIHISPNRDYNRRQAARTISDQLKMVWRIEFIFTGYFFKKWLWLLWTVILMMKFIKTGGWFLGYKWIVWILITSHWSLKSYYLLF